MQKTTKRKLVRAVNLIKSSSQPLLYVGGGVICANANPELSV